MFMITMQDLTASQAKISKLLKESQLKNLQSFIEAVVKLFIGSTQCLATYGHYSTTEV